MTRKSCATWSIGVLAALILGGAAVQLWRFMLDEKYAERFSDDRLPGDVRLGAAIKLRETNLRRLVDEMIDYFSTLPSLSMAEPDKLRPYQLTTGLLQQVLADLSASEKTFCVRVLRRTLVKGDEGEQTAAAYWLGLFGSAGIEATDALLEGFRSANENLQICSAHSLVNVSQEWLRDRGLGERELTLERFAELLRVDLADMHSAFGALLTSPSPIARNTCRAFFTLVRPSGHVESLLRGDDLTIPSSDGSAAGIEEE